MNEFRALLLDGIGDGGRQLLEEAGFIVETAGVMDLATLCREVASCHFLAVRSATKVTAEVLAAGKNLLAVGRGGAGLDNIDSKAATNLGIVVFSTPGANAESVAECTLAHILTVLHKMSAGLLGMYRREWLKKECQGRSLQGKTVGIIGAGYVGKWLMRFLEPFGVSVLTYDVNPSAGLPWVPQVELAELLESSDIITLHVPLSSETAKLINAERLGQMKPGAILINCGRGEVVDEPAIIEALTSSRLGAYAADVYPKEPPDFSGPLFGKPELIESGRLVLTPHLAASSLDAQGIIKDMLAEQALRFFRKGEMPQGANFPPFYLPRQSKTTRLIVFHHDAQGTTADILDVVRVLANLAGNINQRVAVSGAAYTVVDIDQVEPGDLQKILAGIKLRRGILRVHLVY